MLVWMWFSILTVFSWLFGLNCYKSMRSQPDPDDVFVSACFTIVSSGLGVYLVWDKTAVVAYSMLLTLIPDPETLLNSFTAGLLVVVGVLVWTICVPIGIWLVSDKYFRNPNEAWH